MNSSTATFTEKIEKIENIIEHKIQFQISELSEEMSLL